MHNVSDEHKNQIANALQEMLAAEVIKQAHQDLRARGVREEFLDETGLRSSLQELPLPEGYHPVFEARIRQLAMRMKRRENGGGGPDLGDGDEGPPVKPHRRTSGGTGTILQPLGDPGCLACAVTGVPGTMVDLSGNNPLPAPPQGQTTITMAVILTVNTIFGKEFSDALRLVVDFASGLPSNQMLVGLASEVNWAKEIYAWNMCFGTLASVHQSGKNSNASFMLLKDECGGAETIVFTKPQTLGVWADVANFQPSLFWTVFGGKKLTFTWIVD
jgi:hypothetical protein